VFASLFLPHSVAVALAIGAGLLATGALHEIGLARLVGALAAAPGPDRQSAAPGDVRAAAGAAGAVAIAAVLILRFETLANLPSDWVAVSLVCAQAFSRGCAALLAYWLPAAPAAQADALAESTGDVPPSAIDVAVAIALAVVPLAFLVAWTGTYAQVLIASLLALAATAALRRMLRRRMQRFGSAPLGAAQQAAEAAFYLGMLIVQAPADVPVPEVEEIDPEP
ncbi:MAG TPA: adenosylcobinamide-GDP ribazoletransferase, partial [Burkholderiaceae bacterium]|nr:adenosylcobinamide-GDP ribazoletransferase [Burkholderiaceae bacterium]